MKHSVKVIVILLSLFFISQLVGIAVISSYSPKIVQVTTSEGVFSNITFYNLPYGTEPPQDTSPKYNLISMVIAIFIGVALVLLLMKYKVALFLRYWFLFVIIIALAIAINSFFLGMNNSSLIALAIAIPLAVIKVFKRNIIVHNATEVLIYPGIAAIFSPLFNVTTMSIFLIIISAYDMYAVWHAGFMQKMAKYQINEVRVFSGLMIPYIGKKERLLIDKFKKLGKLSQLRKKIKINMAILGGGDIVMPIILSGVVLRAFGVWASLIVAIGATLALATLFYFSEKGKFYPAMPFITCGLFLALLVIYLITIF